MAEKPTRSLVMKNRPGAQYIVCFPSIAVKGWNANGLRDQQPCE
jgi:hypothetical protein